MRNNTVFNDRVSLRAVLPTFAPGMPRVSASVLYRVGLPNDFLSRNTLIRRRERLVHTWPLNRYLASYKVQHTHCAQCGEPLKHTFLAFNGQPLPLRAIKLLTVRVDAATWRTYRAGLQALCRSCSQLLDARDSPYFDLPGV